MEKNSEQYNLEAQQNQEIESTRRCRSEGQERGSMSGFLLSISSISEAIPQWVSAPCHPPIGNRFLLASEHVHLVSLPSAVQF